MSFYRFESEGIGIYEAVDRACPKDDIRRNDKPDGSWLAKVGTHYPGAISFWTENGLRKYLSSGLFHWHRGVVGTPVKVIESDGFKHLLYQDDLQVIVSQELSTSGIRKACFDVVLTKAWEWLRSKDDRNGITLALDLLTNEIEFAPNQAKPLFELAGAYDFLGREQQALRYYKEVRRLGVNELPPADQHCFYIQMGSTLRNCLQLSESRQLLTEGITKFPAVRALPAFLALTEYTDRNYKQAAEQFGKALAMNGTGTDSSLNDYSQAIKFYIDNIESFPASIRQATNSDRNQIEDLIFGVLKEYGLQADPNNTDADLQDIETNYIRAGGSFEVVELQDGSIVGTAGLLPLNDETCELRKMYLAKKARGQGLGKKLMDRLLQRAALLGFRKIELETASVLKKAISLYKRYGFKEIVRSHLASRCDQAYVLELNTAPQSEFDSK